MPNLIFKVGGRDLSVSRRWWKALEGPKPQRGFACDGCSNSPDSWRGYKIWPACVIHDYHYRSGVLGGTWRDRQEADAIFRRNVVTLVKLQGGWALTANRLAWLYWGRVRIWGRTSYQGWDNPKASLPWHRRFMEAWGLGSNESDE